MPETPPEVVADTQETVVTEIQETTQTAEPDTQRAETESQPEAQAPTQSETPAAADPPEDPLSAVDRAAAECSSSDDDADVTTHFSTAPSRPSSPPSA